MTDVYQSSFWWAPPMVPGWAGISRLAYGFRQEPEDEEDDDEDL